ncbi:class I SAM-dependent methyltransferase [Roseisalinus antarcticus]|uniref:Uncharacterized protein n=1 Tax=Roseisalinus antarcticus TaxID=254357 RepID=A0A1Y5TQA4_9RHOB|nr:class I SAM-dependent methyltransferase [Roseisalinus antarcticus]SLN65674.1 hypothetical protein ROA7023_03090 [Roseisalinus antarcticus]
MSKPPSRLDQGIAAQVRALLDGPITRQVLNIALRVLAKWRARLIENTLTARQGRIVAGGPFAGLNYTVGSAEGALLPRLLGCYEATIAPVIEEIATRNYGLVIDVGAAEGYYAVGLAMRMPGVQVWARDSNAIALERCRKLAADNGVADRVTTGGIVTHDDLAVCAEARTLLICDIEGAEEHLLDLLRAPALARADILVECHDSLQRSLSTKLAARFASTHEVSRYDREIRPDALPDWSEEMSDLDRLLFLWEWRAGSTPWLWMQARR